MSKPEEKQQKPATKSEKVTSTDPHSSVKTNGTKTKDTHFERPKHIEYEISQTSAPI